MGLNDTPSGERVHIGFFGRRNAGKSSLVNAVTGQELAVVSPTRGTTTDPVTKAMELLPIGPVLIIDTPGFDDEGALGELRVQKTRQVLNRTDVAVLVVDATEGLMECDKQLIALFAEKSIPYLIAWNKCDLLSALPDADDNRIFVSAATGQAVYTLKERIAVLGKAQEQERFLVRDFLHPTDLVVLVIPIDKAAPKGRLILPQQQVIRDALEAGSAPICVRDVELSALLKRLAPLKPSLVITDSQAFKAVSAIVPDDILLTSFSILMARYKGILSEAVHGVTAIDHLKEGDTVLISEGCTHHRQCDDIGTVKLPRWLQRYTGKQLHFAFSSGRSFPDDLSPYAMVIHCGGCMLNNREVCSRMKCAHDQNVPMTNYGTCIAHMNGILKRSLRIFPDLERLL